MKIYSLIRKTPLIRILLLYIIGILIANYYNSYLSANANLIFIIASILSIALLIIGFTKSLSKFFDYILIPTIISFAISHSLFNAKVPTNFENEHIWQGIIYEKPLLKNNSILLTVKIAPKQFNSFNFLKPQKVFLYTSKDSNIISSARIGDKIIFKAALKRIKNYGNPHEFDYAKYMFNKGIAFQTYAPIEKVQFFEANKLPVKYFLSLIQENALSQFNASIDDKNALAIVSALTLGYKHYLSDELKQSFINSGAIHVLAVSGLHVGIIYMFLNFLLGFFKNKLSHKILKTTIIISIIWLYAILSGLSPSISRAAVMFSIIGIGKTLNRDISFFNILSCAAIILLLVNPLSLYDVGFQLSFLAVGGIVYFQPILYGLFNFKYKIVDWVYQLFTVSIAAQLITTPISLYYFHQFPSYFWLTNIFLIPLISISLIASIILLLTSWVPYFSEILSFCLEHILKITNYWVSFIENLPYAVLENIHFSNSSLIISIALIIITTSFLKSKKPAYLYIILSFLIFGGTTNIINNFRLKQPDKVIFYNLPRQDNIGIYNGKQSYLLYKSTETNHKKTIKSYFNTHWLKMHNTQQVKIIPMESFSVELTNFNSDTHKLNRITLSNKDQIIIYNTNNKELASSISSKYLFICNNIWPPKANISSEILILSNTLPRHIKLAWIDYANRNNLTAIDLSETGAYSIQL